MFSTCIFCHASLGANESIEHFPVGARLAFDADRGRLWAVCPKCKRWNLTPIEDRYEAIEECERAYRIATKRVSTDNISLARLRDNTDLIRIGQPLRPEFAAWRYERVVHKRRWKRYGAYAFGIAAFSSGNIVRLLGGPTLSTAMTAGGALLGLSVTLSYLYWHNHEFYWRRHMRLAINDGTLAELTMPQLHATTCRVDPECGLRVGLTFGGHRRGLQRLLVDGQHAELAGASAHAALRRVIVGLNYFGASREEVRSAVTLLETAMNADPRERLRDDSSAQSAPPAAMNILSTAERQAEATENPDLLAALSTPHSLALEMALHEDDERRAIAGELGALYARWEEAERVATISDGVLTHRALHV